MGLPEFVLVTGNAAKALEVERLLGWRPPTAAVDLPEIQSLDVAEVVEAKAREAWSRLARPLVVEDTSLELAALGGFPGPLVKWLLQAAGPAGIWRLGHSLGDLRVRAVCLIGFFDGATLQTFRGEADGELVEPRGTGGFGWDPIFRPLGESLSYAEMSGSHKDRVDHRGRAWRAFAGLPPPG